MERRKFLIGTGALASGSAAAVGTGAFTTATAERTVNVDVVGDGSAFLSITAAEEPDGGLHENAEEYVDTSGDTVSFDFTNSNEFAGNGNGLNDDTVFNIDNLIDFTNQGTQPIIVGEVNNTLPNGISFYAEGASGEYDGSAPANESIGGGSSFDSPGQGSNPLPNSDNVAVIDVGETLQNIGVTLDTNSLAEGSYTVQFRAVRQGGNRS